MMMSHRCLPHSSYFRKSRGTFSQTLFRPQLAVENSSERALAQGHARLVSRLVGPDAPPCGQICIWSVGLPLEFKSVTGNLSLASNGSHTHSGVRSRASNRFHARLDRCLLGRLVLRRARERRRLEGALRSMDSRTQDRHARIHTGARVRRQ